jgi:hypothetical protein
MLSLLLMSRAAIEALAAERLIRSGLVGAGVRSVRREAAGGRWLDGGGVTAVTCGRRRQGGGVWAGK